MATQPDTGREPDKERTQTYRRIATEQNIKDRIDSISFRQQIGVLTGQFFQPLYQRLFSGRSYLIDDIEIRLRKANISTPVELYTTQWIAWLTLVGGLIGIAITTFSLILVGNVPATIISTIGDNVSLGVGSLPQVVNSALAVVGLLAYVVVVLTVSLIIGVYTGTAAAYYAPEGSISRRKREIDLLMPDTVGLMHALSVGGMNTLEIIEQVAQSEGTLGEVATEFRNINHRIQYNQEDYKSALKSVAEETPSDQLAQFLNDIRSVIDSGGDISQFLDDQKDVYMNERKRNQDDVLEYLDLLGQVYASLTIMPLMLLVILVIMALFGDADLYMLMGVVYILLPVLNLAYMVMVSTITPDRTGSGKLKDPHGTSATETHGDSNMELVKNYIQTTTSPVFEQIKHEELWREISHSIRNPSQTFTRSPRRTLLVTVPLTGLLFALLLVQGTLATSPAGLFDQPLLQTFFWVGMPFFVIGTPLAVYYEFKLKKKRKVVRSLTDDLRKLANANASGQPLVETFRVAGTNNDSVTGKEFRKIYKKTAFDVPLQTALVSFNNKYQLPRLARSVTLIEKAQKASSQITEVLWTAADLSEIQDEIDSRRNSNTNMQTVVVVMSFFTFIAVLLILDVFFLEQIEAAIAEQESQDNSDIAEQGGLLGIGGGLSGDVLSTLYIHAAILQGFFAGITAGYAKNGNILQGLKYALSLVLAVFIAWGATGLVL